MDDTSRSPSFVALALSVLALAFAVAVFVRDRGPSHVEADGKAIDEARIARLEETVAQLAERGTRSPAAERTRAPVGSAGAAGADGSVADRLADLEEAVRELEGDVDETASQIEALAAAARTGPTTAIRNATPTPEQVAELRRLALDPEAETRPRLLAVRQLARVEDGRTVAVARAMRKLYEESEDEGTRTAAVGLLEGVVLPELEPWLVDALLHARHSSTRESATDVLSHYVGSAAVRAALHDAAQNDANHDVRSDAQNALDKLDEREQER